MSKLTLGTICGLVFGLISAGMMLPMEFPDKRAALAGAFFNRFSIGFVIGAVDLPYPGWLIGLIFGVLLSVADAIITRAWLPIILVGAIGGRVIGYITKH
jgi:hypothetical protein